MGRCSTGSHYLPIPFSLFPQCSRILGQAPRSLNESELPLELKDAAIPPILNLAEAAKLVRCSRAHLCNVINGKVRGIPHLPTVRIGRRVLFRRESLELEG